MCTAADFMAICSRIWYVCWRDMTEMRWRFSKTWQYCRLQLSNSFLHCIVRRSLSILVIKQCCLLVTYPYAMLMLVEYGNCEIQCALKCCVCNMLQTLTGRCNTWSIIIEWEIECILWQSAIAWLCASQLFVWQHVSGTVWISAYKIDS